MDVDLVLIIWTLSTLDQGLILTYQVIYKMRKQKDNILVFLLLIVYFVEELNIFLLDVIKLVLRLVLLFFIFKDTPL